MNKVFGIGFGKTGTTTLKDALQVLGYRVCGRRKAVVELIKNDEWDEIWNLTEDYDAFEDDPWPVIFKELDQRYPNSRFILTVRDEKKWIKSLTNSMGRRKSPVREFIYGKGCPEGNEEIYLDRYRSHNSEVIDYFKNKNQLLVVDWENNDGWSDLCKFLEKPIPDKPFFHSNKGAYSFGSKIIKSYGHLKNRVFRRLGFLPPKIN